MRPVQPKSSKDSPIWELTATEMRKLLNGEVVYRAGRPYRIQIKKDVIERELDSIVEKILV